LDRTIASNAGFVKIAGELHGGRRDGSELPMEIAR